MNETRDTSADWFEDHDLRKLEIALAQRDEARAQLAAAEAKTTILLHSEVYHKDRADTAESRLKIAREALEFYADPFAWKKLHDPEDDIRVPDFYSETSFGDTAIEAILSLTEGEGK